MRARFIAVLRGTAGSRLRDRMPFQPGKRVANGAGTGNKATIV
ncbi:conserved hypothetical protein [Burkholderia pseudomallei Pakistan 9]|nr:hypothetical protein BURPS668_A2690 [Burkholderia pseudomallei 668]EEH28127.1 conserved hypothetical protein [Burkholderia pseudomallei Pakistan 9]